MIEEVFKVLFSRNSQPCLVFIAGILYVVYYYLLQPFYFSALRKVPGPYFYRVSYLPSLNAQRVGCWIDTVHKLHQKYGDVVVLSPNEISMNGKSEYIKDIYVRNFKKGSFYAQFSNFGKPNPFCESSNEKHMQYKKVLTGMYQKSFIISPNNYPLRILQKKVQGLIKNISQGSLSRGDGPRGLDIYLISSCLTFDVILNFELGENQGTNLTDDVTQRELIRLLHIRGSMLFWTTQAPQFWNLVASREIKNAAQEVDQWLLNLYANSESSNRDPEGSVLNIIKSKGYQGNQAYSFLTDNILAGHHTSAVQLTYMCYELSRPVNKHWQDQLRDTLRMTFGLPDSNNEMITDVEKLDQVPLLDALLKENLRLHASLPGAFPRVVDRTYKVDIESGGDAEPITVPEGTVVSCLPYAMHRRPDIFPSPDSFLPSRWLPSKTNGESTEKSKEKILTQLRFIMSFGKGIRLCLGMNLATIELKLAIANIYWHFASEISPEWCKSKSDALDTPGIGEQYKSSYETVEQKMLMADTYNSYPICNECWLVFKRPE